MIKGLSEFIASKGVDTMDLKTYKSFGNDVPVKDYLLKRYFGSWNRVLSVVKKRYPISVAPVEVKVEKPAPKPKAKKEVKDVKKSRKDISMD